MLFISRLVRIALQLIPARGRKLRHISKGLLHLGVATYPREGTETQPESLKKCTLYIVSTYPREGTETISGRRIKSCAGFQLIPARGRKLARCLEHGLSVLFQLIPARGRKR